MVDRRFQQPGSHDGQVSEIEDGLWARSAGEQRMSLRQPPDRCIVEIDGEPVGVVVSDEAGFTFIAASRRAFALDRASFSSIERAVKEVQTRLGSAQHLKVSSPRR